MAKKRETADNADAFERAANDLSELENSTELIQQLRRQQEALQAANEELAATEEELRVQNEELAASRAELDRTRARYQDLFESAPDGYVVTDPEGTIQEMNHAAARLLGRPASELRGNPFSALFAETAKEAYLQILTSLTRGASAIPKWEVETQRAKGAPFWASVTMAAARDEDGKTINLRWLVRDVTDLKQAEENLRNKAEELRKSNAELAYFNKIMVGRELRMIELKKEIDHLCRQFGQPPRYGYGDHEVVDPGHRDQ
jgi:PAS domain S-box-containing protein